MKTTSKPDKSSSFQSLEIKTSWGTITLTLDGKTVVGCALPFLKNTPRKPFEIEIFQTLESNCVAAQRFTAQVQSFFQPLEKPASPDAVSPSIGKQLRCGTGKDLPGTDFQKAVWKELKKIPRGQTRTYGEIAAAIGRPNAVRAVGTACGANPVPLLIPCHRVTAQNGLSGFGSGLPWKTLLLKTEGAL